MVKLFVGGLSVGGNLVVIMIQKVFDYEVFCNQFGFKYQVFVVFVIDNIVMIDLSVIYSFYEYIVVFLVDKMFWYCCYYFFNK